jgi:hydroxymethylpyrimidine pyrophosphatase-like HAD family hydrolase
MRAILMHKDVYLFDVDGTLTNSRSLIDPDFKEFFLNFIANHNVCIVTGSDYSKTLEQLGEDISAVAIVYGKMD